MIVVVVMYGYLNNNKYERNNNGVVRLCNAMIMHDNNKTIGINFLDND